MDNLMPREEMERILFDQEEHFRDLEAENSRTINNQLEDYGL